jgi:hypothetical protein
LLEFVKILVPLLTGGLAGALFNEWLRRKHTRVQPIPLIERVNRLLGPEIQGFTLARVVDGSANRQLEEVKGLREYQLTMRNGSSIHLQDAEVQFEFPADDVEAWASRPTLSKTALVPLDALASEPWKKAFRWRIPHFPIGDTVEFTFRAVDPSSEKYEAALYHPDGVVFERVIGEPPPKRVRTPARVAIFGIFTSIITALSGVLLWGALTGKLQGTSGERLTTLKLAGCDLRIVSLFDVYGQRYNSPWRIKQRVFNVGAQNCEIQSEQVTLSGPVNVKPGDIFEKESISESSPKLVDMEILVGVNPNSLSKATIPLYVER